MIKKIKWKFTRPAERQQIYIYVGFSFYGSEEDYNFLVNHYHHLAILYRLEMGIYHKWESDGKEIDSYIRVHLRKTIGSLVLNPKALLMIFENDSKCLQRIHQLHEVLICDDSDELDEFLLKESLEDYD